MANSNKSILEEDEATAKGIFLSNHFYTNSALLENYWNFSALLKEIDENFTVCTNTTDINKSTVNSRVNQSISLSVMNFKQKDKESVNCIIDIEKDNYASRPVTFINPILYVALVQVITETNNWKELKDFFKDPMKPYQTQQQTQQTTTDWDVDDFNKKIVCESNSFNYANNNEKVSLGISWWKNVEQNSLAKALEYNCYINTDISNFYPSIYTHSIPWALYTKAVGKTQRNKLLGNQIDVLIQAMQHGQTNGIPQGSQLMDFIAEVLLKGIDRDLYLNIKKNTTIKEYYIIRYRDDYRIFANDIVQARLILAELIKTLKDYGLNINDKKTNIVEDIITYSIKPDKQHTLPLSYNQKNKSVNLQALLLYVNQLSKSYRNGAQIIKHLKEATEYVNAKYAKSNYTLFEIFTEIALLINVIKFINPSKYLYKWFLKKNTIAPSNNNNYIVLISIVVEIALNNSKPQILDLCTELIDNFLFNIKNTERKKEICNNIIAKINNATYKDALALSLQKILIRLDSDLDFSAFADNLKSDNKFYTSLNNFIKDHNNGITYNDIWDYQDNNNIINNLNTNLINQDKLDKAKNERFRADILRSNY